MTLLIVIVAVIAVLAIGTGLVAWMARRNEKKRESLREEFGPEYHSLRARYGDDGRATEELEARQNRVQSYNIRPLATEDARRFAEEWRVTQGKFVDDPSGAIGEAEGLVTRVMEARGYPTGDFETQYADVSVGHSEVVQNYRAAHDIAERNRRGEAGTEDLRQAMVHYRSLFEELLGAETAQRR
jgi:hypothetical protein